MSASGIQKTPRRIWRMRLADHLRAFRAAVCERIIDKALDWHPDANGNITSYAESELRLAGWFNEDGFYGGMVGSAVMRSVRIFSIEGHSGMSAGLCMNLTKQVGMFKPLTPLTGEDDEWNEVCDGVFQNRRMSSIFKENGEAYWIEGRVFESPDGARYTSNGSRVSVQFPWTPVDPEIVKVEATQ